MCAKYLAQQPNSRISIKIHEVERKKKKFVKLTKAKRPNRNKSPEVTEKIFTYSHKCMQIFRVCAYFFSLLWDRDHPVVGDRVIRSGYYKYSFLLRHTHSLTLCGTGTLSAQFAIHILVSLGCHACLKCAHSNG